MPAQAKPSQPPPQILTLIDAHSQVVCRAALSAHSATEVRSTACELAPGKLVVNGKEKLADVIRQPREDVPCMRREIAITALGRSA